MDAIDLAQLRVAIVDAPDEVAQGQEIVRQVVEGRDLDEGILDHHGERVLVEALVPVHDEWLAHVPLYAHAHARLQVLGAVAAAKLPGDPPLDRAVDAARELFQPLDLVVEHADAQGLVPRDEVLVGERALQGVGEEEVAQAALFAEGVELAQQDGKGVTVGLEVGRLLHVAGQALFQAVAQHIADEVPLLSQIQNSSYRS